MGGDVKRMAAKPRKPAKPRRMAMVPEPPKPTTRPAAPPPAKKMARAPRMTKAPPGTYFSVQVATCRTDKCVNAFMGKLRAKGYEPFVGGRSAAGASSKMTEVLLGDFAKKSDAMALASNARRKKLRVSLYQRGEKWRVSAGSFADLEDAAQRLDRVEDSGLKGTLIARTAAAGKSGLRWVRIGKLSSRQEAIAMLGRVSRAGFSGSYVVRRK